MARRSPAVPDGLELIGEPDPQRDAPTTSAPWWSWVAVVVAAAAVLTLVADRRSGDAGPLHHPRPSGLGIFDSGEIDLADATPRAEASFPLFGRNWDLALVVLQLNSVVAVDLDTGVAEVVAELEGDAARATIIDIVIVEDSIHLLGGRGEIFRITDDNIEIVVPEASGTTFAQTIGGTYVAMTDLNGGSPVTSIRSAMSGEEIAVQSTRAAAGVDEVLLVSRADTIVARDRSGNDSLWATGELLLTGTASVAWWTCTSPSGSNCQAWAGDSDEPRLVALDTETTTEIASNWARPEFAWQLPAPPVLSPDGRLAWELSRSDDPNHQIEIRLTDLGDGSHTTIHGADSTPTFTPSGDALALNHGVIPAIVDLTTGETARIRLVDNAGAPVSRTIAFMATAALP